MLSALLSLMVLSVLQGITFAAPPACKTDVPEPVAAAFYASWHATEGFPLSSLSWHKYNTLIYSFA